MPRIRAFIAIPSSGEIKQSISAVQAELIKSQADVKWEGTERFHITLKFLGDSELEVLQSLEGELQTALRDIHSFDLVYRSVGCFPNISRPRVVWIGAAENPQLSELQRRIEEVCGRFGFPKEDRAFHAHITLGRVRGNRHLDRLTEIVKTVTFEPMQARCAEVHIMRSELRPTGSVYTLLNSIPLVP